MENTVLIELRRLENCGNLKAFADLIFPTSLGDVTIKGFRVVQKEGSDPWVGFPQTSFQKNGSTKYVPLLELNRRVRNQVQEIILKEFKKQSK